ncbi:MAG TPA: Rv2175c family DNA-binding protein [Pseudonocardiaceae bacterium]
MSTIPVTDDVLAPEIEVLAVPDVAERLALPVTRVHQMLRDHQLLAMRRDGVIVIPAEFLTDDGPVKGLTGTITVLRDGGYRDTDILRWLFTEDESLPGTPVSALRADRGREVKRRAQAMAF